MTNLSTGSSVLSDVDEKLRLTAIELLENELAKRARTDSSLFAEFVMQDPETGRYFKQDDIHVKWHQLLKDYQWNLIESFRGSGKSEQVGIAWPIWMLGNNTNLRIGYITDIDKQAAKRVKAIGDLIAKSKRIQKVFPNLKPDYKTKWTDHAITINRNIISTEPSIEGYGILSAGTGTRKDVLIFDDVVTIENTLKKPAEMEKVKSSFREKWLNTLTKGGIVVYIFTRWHEFDLSHELIAEATQDEPGIQQFKYTVDIIDPDKMETIMPNLWTNERLEAQRKAIGERAFMRNFCGKAMSADESIFDAIDLCCNYEMKLSDIHENWYKYCFTGVDLGHRSEAARTSKDKAYTVIFTGIRTPDGKKIPIDIRRGRWGGVETADQIISVHNRYHPGLILVENNGYQESINEWIAERFKNQGFIGTRPVTKGYFTGNQKFDELLGLPGLAVEFENRDWVIPMGDDEHHAGCKCMYCNWINEMKMYSIAAYKDQVMACWLFRQAAMGGAFSPSDLVSSRDGSVINRMEGFGA